MRRSKNVDREGVALWHLLARHRVVERHQADRLGRQRIVSRLADEPMTKYPAIEGLMLGTHGWRAAGAFGNTPKRAKPGG